MRTALAGVLIIIGCSVLTLVIAGVLLAMPLQVGHGLAVSVAAMAGAVCLLGIGVLVLRYR